MPTYKNLIGQIFGKLTIIKSAPHKGKRTAWLCKCECGNEKEIVGYNLVNGKTISCGCQHKISALKTVKNILGERFHKLTVIKQLGQIKKPQKRHMYWLCKCDCGNELIVDGVSLRNGQTKSCGCRRVEVALINAKKLLSKNPKLFSAKKIWKSEKSNRTNYADGDLTFEQFVELTQLPCHYCGRSSQQSNIINAYKRKQIFKTALDNLSDGEFRYNGLDRVDNSKTHNLDNVVPCCKYCNQAKMDRDYNEFISWIKQAAEYLKQKEKDSI